METSALTASNVDEAFEGLIKAIHLKTSLGQKGVGNILD